MKVHCVDKGEKMKKVNIALATPRIRLADTAYNAELLANMAIEADGAGAEVIVFPELSLTGATLGSLYLNEAVISGAERALEYYIEKTADISLISFIGLPVFDGERVFDAVAVVSGGELIGLSVSGEGVKAPFAVNRIGEGSVSLFGEKIKISESAVYTNGDVRIFCEVGYKGAPTPTAAASSADVIVNPIAEAEYIGYAAKRRKCAENYLCTCGAYLLVGAGEGESGTDGIYAAPRVAAFGGKITEYPLFSCEFTIVSVEVGEPACRVVGEDVISISRSPFVPDDIEQRRDACALALEIQSRALAARIERSYSKTSVLGVSGGLDSTLAVLVAARAADILGRGRESVIAITMPCFGTSERTKSNALLLADELGCTTRTIDIKAAVNQHFKDISHDEKNYNVVYENAQARERTQILMDVANAEGGLVVGTGDLSELALGFATYNGDHMSMYCVNGSVPKTLMRAIIGYAADEAEKEGKVRLASVLRDVIDTPVSPELLPTDDGKENAQHTESIVGPYELHDFFLYHTVISRMSPRGVFEAAGSAFRGVYSDSEIERYLEIFTRRFLTQQFKRSCMPDGPRVTEISLSPRGAWAMPSDVSTNLWKEYFKK